jgi:hypothetical protein
MNKRLVVIACVGNKDRSYDAKSSECLRHSRWKGRNAWQAEAAQFSLETDDPFYAEAKDIFHEVILLVLTEKVNTSASFAPL